MVGLRRFRYDEQSVYCDVLRNIFHYTYNFYFYYSLLVTRLET